MLSSGNHVKIGSDEFQLDESIDAQSNAVGGSLFRPHYKHSFQNVFEGRTPVLTGDPAQDEVRPERLIWSFSDWAAGEGNRTFAADSPSIYDFSYGVNTRIRGQITGRPNRSRDTVVTEDVTQYGGLAIGENALWLGQDRRLHYSTTGFANGESGDGGWTTKTLAQGGFDGSTLASSYYITALAGDDKYLYYAGWDDSPSNRVVRAIQQSGSSQSVVDEASVNSQFKGMTIMHGRLYGWTGQALIEMDIFQSWPLGASYRRNVSGDAVNDLAFTGSHWADCVSAKNTVYCFASTHGQTMVYQFKLDGGFGTLWAGPQGFTAKSMVYQNGVLFIAGHWGGDSSRGAGKGAIYAFPTDTHEERFLGWFRKQNNMNLQMQEMCNSYGSQIIVTAAWTGRVFIYDADTDGITMLDDIATSGSGGAEDAAPRIPAVDGDTFVEGTNKILAVKTFGQKRVVATYEPDGTPGADGNIQLFSYDDDEPNQRQASTSTADAVTKLEVGDNDFGLAFEQKILLGFHVLFKPLTTGQSFVVSYSLDGNTYVDLTAVTSSSDDASKGRTWIPVSTTSATKKFGRFRWKIKLTGARTAGNDKMPPVIYNVTAECTLIAYDETWDLILRMKDEQPLTRPTTHQFRGSNARGRLFTAKSQQKILTLLDGYRYRGRPGPPLYSSHSVIIDSIEDIVTVAGEGACKIRLRSVPN